MEQVITVDGKTINLKLWENYGKRRVYLTDPSGKTRNQSDWGWVDEKGNYTRPRHIDNIRGYQNHSDFEEMLDEARRMLGLIEEETAEQNYIPTDADLYHWPAQ